MGEATTVLSKKDSFINKRLFSREQSSNVLCHRHMFACAAAHIDHKNSSLTMQSFFNPSTKQKLLPGRQNKTTLASASRFVCLCLNSICAFSVQKLHKQADIQNINDNNSLASIMQAQTARVHSRTALLCCQCILTFTLCSNILIFNTVKCSQNNSLSPINHIFIFIMGVFMF